MSTLKAWRQVVTPHEDIRKGRFDASVFAADLGEVVAGRGAVDYRDPVVFFGKTYVTKGLTDLLTGVMRRVAGHKDGEPVVQMQTPFGGGKTHTLLAIYHLLNDPSKVANIAPVKKLVADAGLKTIPNARVACLVGTAMNVAGDRTMWGEIAYQLGGESLYKLVEKEDKAKTAPGSNLLGEMLEKCGPCVILMDEILVYLVNAEKIRMGDWSLRGSTLTFLQQLTIAVANCPHAVLVATLTSQASEWLDTEGAERAFQSLEKVIGRVEKVKLPVEGMEVYEVIRRRLFEDLGDSAEHQRTVEAYFAKYRALGDDVAQAVKEPAYKQNMLAAYPFHPELLTTLYERWGSIPDFQRTRGVLRLLAYVVSDLYNRKDNEPLIQSCSVNLGTSEIRGELVKYAGSAFHGVVDSDIAGPDAKAPEIDRSLGSEYAKESVAEKLAKAIFMYSFGGGHQKGATTPQLRLAALNPEMNPPFITDALDRMSKRLWFLYGDGGLYRFESKQNLNRTILDREEMVRSDQDRVRQFAKAKLNDMIGEVHFRVFRYPHESRDVADDARLSLVVLDLHQTAAETGLPKDTEKFVSDIVKQHGQSFRKHANALIFIAPDEERSAEVTEAATRLLALQGIDEDKTTKKRLTPEQLTDLAGRLKNAEAGLPSKLAQAYRHVIVATDKKALRSLDMGVQTYDGRTTISDRVYGVLKDNDQLLERVDPALLVGKRWSLWPDEEPMVNAKTLAGYFTQLTHLPMLAGAGVLRETVARGVERGLFAYALGDGTTRQFDSIRFKVSLRADECELIESAWLLRPALAEELLPKPVPVETAGTTPGGAGTTTTAGGGQTGGIDEPLPPPGPTKIVEGERRLDLVRIKMRVPWEHWGDIYNEVIEPLANEGAEIIVDVNIVAKAEGAIRENTVEFGIKESLSQRGISAQVETR
jgi:predicted AAA+ superfamily ATPase